MHYLKIYFPGVLYIQKTTTQLACVFIWSLGYHAQFFPLQLLALHAVEFMSLQGFPIPPTCSHILRAL